jgi:hypothetical protein
MDIQAPFGIVTGCHAGDKFMVGATLASIRYYCSDTPVCLVVDGDFDVSDLERDYDLIVLRISDLPSEEMRKMIGGNYRAKLSAMWEGPFEFYVWLDCDAIVSGNFIEQVQVNVDFQIFWDGISISADAEEVPDWLGHYYFNIEKLSQLDADFEWRGHAYFCSGAFGCRRNAISFQQWAEIERWQKQVPDLFQWGEMGMLNYLVHSLTQQGEMRTGMTDLQNIPGYNGKEELEEDCKGSCWRFPKHIERPRIAHFCGRKPNIFDAKAYSKPFTIARLEHHRRRHSLTGAWVFILWEDGRICLRKLWGRTKRRLSKYRPSI